MKETDLIIIGGGSAGMAAALKAHELGVKDILILEKNDYLGGILNQCIHNGFGLIEFNEELTGPEFMSFLDKKVDEASIPYRLATTVLNISKDKIVTYTNEKEGYVEIKAKAIILTTGCYERNAGAIALAGSRPSGVYTAGQAQLYLNIYGYLVGKKVVILGSGDIGLIMARRMTLEGAKVLAVLELNPYSAGLNRNIVQCLNDFNIPLYLSTTVKEIKGKNKLEKVIAAKVDEHFNFIKGTEIEFDADTLLLSVGLIPNANLLNNLDLTWSKTRGPKVNQDMETSIPGIFASGNVLHVHDLVDYVTKEAREAAIGATKFINGQLTHEGIEIEVNAGEGIGYVVPGLINIHDANPEITLKFRVKCPYKEVNIFIEQGDNLIKKLYKNAIIPSEMEIVTIKKEQLIAENTPISVSIRRAK